MKAYILHQYAQKVSYLLTKQLDLAEKNLKRREMNTHTYLVVSLQGEADSRCPFGTPTLSLAKDYTAAYTTRLVEHKIPTGEAKPMRLPPYKIPHALNSEDGNRRNACSRTHITLEQRVSSPIVFVKKKDGTMRLFVNYK